MGILRGAGVVILSVLFFLSLFFSGVCLTIGLSLKYENVQHTLTNISGEIIGQQEEFKDYLIELEQSINDVCKSNLEYVYSYKGKAYVLSCEDVASKGINYIIDASISKEIGDAIDEYYYKEYDCNFIQCFKNKEFGVVISNKAREYWMSKAFFFILASFILAFLIFILLEHRTNWFFLIGGIVLLTGLIISKLNLIGVKIAKIFLSSISTIFSMNLSNEILKKISNLFFIENKKVFVYMLLIGIILISIGIIFKIFNIGFKINSFIEKIKREKFEEDTKKTDGKIKKDIKEIVKEEVKKEISNVKKPEKKKKT